MITHNKAIRALMVALAVVTGSLVVSAQFRIPEQLPEDNRNDILVKTRGIEQPQLSQYAVELPAGNPLTMLPVAGNVYMIAGPGTTNVTVQVGQDGIVLVDSGSAARKEAIAQAVRAVSRLAINFIIMASPNEEAFGNNGFLSAPPYGRPPNQGAPGLGGQVINTQQAANPPAGGRGGGINQVNVATMIAHENLLNRLSAPTGQQAAFPFELWPTSTFFTPRKTVSWNGEAIDIIAATGATTDGDIMAHFRRSDVIAAGDLINTLGYPKIDVKRGGSIDGELKALNDIVEISVAAFNQQGGTKIVPGHGRIMNEQDVIEYRDMMTIIHDRVQQGIQKNWTLAQIQAQRPTLEYDGLYSKPGWTGENLVQAIYDSLRAAAPAAR